MKSNNNNKNIFSKIVYTFSIFSMILGLLSFINGILNNENGYMIIGVMLSLSYSILGLFSWNRIQNEKDFIKFSSIVYLIVLVIGMLPIEYDGSTILSSYNYSVVMLFAGFISNIFYAVFEDELEKEVS